MEREDKLVGFAGATAGNLVRRRADVKGIPGVEPVGYVGVDLYPEATP